MKIALVFPNNVFSAPYLDYYTNFLNKEKTSYKLIIWNRANEEEENTIAFKSNSKSSSPFAKALNYYKFGSFCKKEIKNGDFDKVIVFTPQLAIFLYSFLKKHYSNKYLIDIRDYTTIIPYFKRRFFKLIKQAQTVCISSEGFTSWLPKNRNYIMSHNVHLQRINHYLLKDYNKKNFFNDGTINFDTVGALRDFTTNSSIMKELGNRKDFFLNFIGSGWALPMLQKFALDENINNVHFHGRYDKKEEIQLLQNTDILNIIQNADKISNFAIANRLYLSGLLRIPCIARKNTEHSRVIHKYGLGITIENYNEIPEKIIEYKSTFNKEQFIKNCTVFLQDVKKDYDRFENAVIQFINETH
ncbi:hypothetical protein DZC72_14370 [Maribacter algicola]|uniref:Capsular biosynthesis protein n=1 Tax=Maribacter algicola TaxID=2498892 RepID=A0A426RIP8_9FLAO|nr:hypothetical protein [Maribacter algicola]RRQ48846.1 hypothetical protein DZC72_14370 [Maribacter algicola]